MWAEKVVRNVGRKGGQKCGQKRWSEMWAEKVVRNKGGWKWQLEMKAGRNVKLLRASMA
jgi:hypothetical protein